MFVQNVPLYYSSSLFLIVMQVTRQLRKSGRGRSQRWWKLWALKIWSSTHVKHWSRQLTGMYSVTVWPMHRQSVVHFLSHTSVDPWNMSQQLVTLSVLLDVSFIYLWPCSDEVTIDCLQCELSVCWFLTWLPFKTCATNHHVEFYLCIILSF